MSDLKTKAVREAVILWKAVSDFANDSLNSGTVVKKTHVLPNPEIFVLDTVEEDTSNCPFCFFDRHSEDGHDDCKACLGANLGFPTNVAGRANCTDPSSPFSKFSSLDVTVNHEGCHEMFKMALVVAEHHQVDVSDLL